MATALQNRLVGTIILVALAVIFLPDILDGKKRSNADLFVDVPAQPQMQQVIRPREFPSDAVAQNAARQVEIVNEQALDDVTSESPQPAANLSENASEAQLSAPAQDNSLASQTVVTVDTEAQLESAGWVLQLGSFRHQKNVRALLDKLESAGYRAFSRPVETSSGTLTKVFVGPDVDREKLRKALPHLKQITNLQGKLTPFTVQ